MEPVAGNKSNRKTRANILSPSLAIEVGLVALAALFYTLAAAPYDFAILGWIALAPLFVAIRDKSLGRSAFLGLLFGVLICSGVAYWLFTAISSYFVATFPLDLILTVVAYIVFVGIYTGAVAAAWTFVIDRTNGLIAWFAVPSLWVVGEFARSYLLSGFSWGLLGYSQYRHPVAIQIADITGIYGISFLLACSGYTIAELFESMHRRIRFHEKHFALPWREGVGAAALATLVLTYGSIRIRRFQSHTAEQQVRIALVQHEMPAQDRWQRSHYAKSFLQYVRSTQDAVSGKSVDLIVWPEFASGFYIDREPMARLQLSRLLGKTDTALLLGAPRIDQADGETRYYNSAYLLSPTGTILDTYDKIRLLPFAEYRPTALASIADHPSDYPEQFSAGDRETVFKLPRGSFGVMICFETTYPSFARRLTKLGSQFLVNISNDVWLSSVGGTTASAQHFAMAVMRAVENKRWLARSTMAGVTGFVDPVGRVYGVSLAADGTSVGTVSLSREITLYTRFGDWFVALCVVISIFALLVPAVRPARAETEIE